MKSRNVPLAWIVGAVALPAACAAPSTTRVSVADLGVRTAAPDEEQAADLGLEHDVRWRGRVVVEVESGGAAAAAGLRPGDALVRLDENDLYSDDDVRDFLAVGAPGQTVTAVVQRAGGEVEAVELRLGARPVPAVDGPRMTWQYASLGQLPAALEEARARKKKVLVGLSGAET